MFLSCRLRFHEHWCTVMMGSGGNSLTPPQLSVRARSLPVPSGRMATGGAGLMRSRSIVDRIQPTVPSPPHASSRRLCTFRNISNLRVPPTHDTTKDHGKLPHSRLGGVSPPHSSSHSTPSTSRSLAPYVPRAWSPTFQTKVTPLAGPQASHLLNPALLGSCRIGRWRQHHM